MIKYFKHSGDYATYTSYAPDDLPQGAVAVDDGIDLADKYIVDGVLADRPARPSERHMFNYTTGQWVYGRDLDEAKALKWAEIKAARFAAEYGGFEWGGSPFDSDSVSQQRLSGAVQLAQMDSGFSIAWTLADDTVRTLNQVEMISVGVALGIHVQTGFAKGQALRAQIDAATTQAEVQAVVW